MIWLRHLGRFHIYSAASPSSIHVGSLRAEQRKSNHSKWSREPATGDVSDSCHPLLSYTYCLNTSGLNLLQITLESEEGSRRGRGSANIKLRADVNKKVLRGHFDLHLCLFRTSVREIHHLTAGNASLLWSIFSFAISTVSSIRNKF